MPKNNATDSVDKFFKLPQPGLMAYFGNVVRGQNQVYDTPFAKGESTEALLQAWDEELVSIRDKWPSLYVFEKDLAKKVGPMSIVAPLKDRMDDIRSYYEGILLPSAPVNERALKAVISEWSGARGIRLRSERATVDLMKKSTNSGSPYFTKRRNVVDSTVPARVFYRRGDILQLLPEKRPGNFPYWKACAVLGWRGQEGGPSKEDVKQRVVWMFPFAVNIKELQVYQPLIEAAQKFNIVPAWVSMDEVDKRVTKLFDTKSSNDLVVCTDFTKFDQHFNKSLQDAAQRLLRAILSPDGTDEWFREIFPIKYNIPIMYNWGDLMTGPHGMGSGSGGTNADETLAHRALQFEAAMRRGQMLNPNSQCLGDDGILSYPGITVEDVVRSYTEHGLEMNDSKQYASTQDCVYLRRWHHQEYRQNGICVGVYSTMRALGRLRYLERFQDPEFWGPEMVALRQLSILENVKWHPLRDQFAMFCMKRDKYRLGIDIPGFLANIEQKANEAIDHMPDFLGYTKTLQSERNGIGINNWWIIQFLRSQK